MNKKKVYLSPSNQWENRYAAGNTTEAAQCDRIAWAAKAALDRCGFSAMVGTGGTMAGKCNEANGWGADLYICIHTNAFNGKVMGTRCFASSLSGPGGRAAQAIFNALSPITPGKSESVTMRKDLYEINYTYAPCAYVEAEFHDSPEGAKWIIEHTTQIGEAIAQGVCKHFKAKYQALPAAAPSTNAEEEIDMTEANVRKIIRDALEADRKAHTYADLNDVPDWGKDVVKRLVARGALQGDGTGLNISYDLLRTLVVLDRLGVI